MARLHPEPSSTRPVRQRLAIIVVVALLAIAGCGSDEPAADSTTSATTEAVAGVIASAPSTVAAPTLDDLIAAARTEVESDGITIHRVSAEGDEVALHYEDASSGSEASEAVVEILTFGPDGSIEDRWDVRQPVAGTTASGNTMFDGGGDPAVEADIESNRAAVLRLYDEAFNGGNVEVVDELVAPDYTQHNPAFPDGSGALKTLLANGLPVEVVATIVQGDLVVARVDYGAVPAVDIFRLEEGMIVEHWDVLDMSS